VKIVNKILLKILVAGGLSLALMSTAWGEVRPNNRWTDFYGDAHTRITGDTTSIPVALGTIIDAYTQWGLHCGTYTVDSIGVYGFMPTYGDDFTTSEIDGAIAGSMLFFRIDGKVATPNGPDPAIWIEAIRRKVNLYVPLKVSMGEGSYTKSKEIKAGTTVHFTIAIKNTGEGVDFYKLTCTSAHGWSLKFDPNLFASAGETVYFNVDLTVPPTADPKDNETISFTVRSDSDPSLYISGSLRAYFAATDVDDDNSILPAGFILNQNYPNPFNPSTLISYQLPSSADVSLEIYDLLGRKVNQFDFGRQEAGEHSFEYTAGNKPSGVYFYRIKAGDFSDVKKMVLMK
jgi:hypothetical protein